MRLACPEGWEEAYYCPSPWPLVWFPVGGVPRPCPNYSGEATGWAVLWFPLPLQDGRRRKGVACRELPCACPPPIAPL